MTNVKCVLGYFDTKLNRSVAIGEELEVTEDRANQLVKAKVAEITTTTPKVATKKTKAKKQEA
jgi:hypothetical protein